MANTIYFERGASRFYFGPGTGFSLGLDWRPPAPNMSYNLSGGTSANINGGETKISGKANNRSMVIPVLLDATTETQAVSLVRRLENFIYSDSGNPLYFCAKFNALPQPLWGQFGGVARYEIVTAEVSIGALYETIGLGGSPVFWLPIPATIKPHPLGQPQRLATATGGIYEDPDGAGLVIIPAATNLITNPSFETNVTTGWTLYGTGAARAQSTLHHSGQYSVKLTAATAGSCGIQTDPITVADGESLTVSARLYRETAITCHLAINDGTSDLVAVAPTQTGAWELKTAAWTNNTGSSKNARVLLRNSAADGQSSVWMDSVIATKTAYFIPYFDGDSLGGAWSGTAHLSTASIAAGSVKLPIASDTLSLAQGAAAVTVQWGVTQAIPNSMVLFDTRDASHTASLLGSYNSTTDKFELSDGTNTIFTAAQTFAPGDVTTILFTWGPSGLAIYKNGQLAASGATYTRPANGADLFIGVRYNATLPAIGTIMRFTPYGRQFSAADALADYNACYPIVSSGARADWIPWLWTKDGDNQVDNCDDATRDNWAVAGGVPGSADAVTEFTLTADDLGWNGSLYIGKHTDKYNERRGAGGWYKETGSTAEVGNSNGDCFEITTLNSNEFVFKTTPKFPQGLSGKFYCFVRGMIASGTDTLIFRPYVQDQNGYVVGDDKLIAFTDNYNVLYCGSVYYNPPIRSEEETELSVGVGIDGTPPNATVHLDYVMFVNGEMAKISVSFGKLPYPTILMTGYPSILKIKGNKTTCVSPSYTSFFASLAGDVIELSPERYNLLQSIIPYYRDYTFGTWTGITRTMTYTLVTVTPRWGLL
jgi:hypothetical protein